MRPLDIDFAPRRRPVQGMWWAVAAIGAVAVGLFAMALLEKTGTARIEAGIARLRAEPVVAPAPESSVVEAPAYESSARQMLTERLAAWPAALKALEVTQVPGIQVVGVDLSATEQRLRVDVQYEDLAQLLRYIAELNAGEATPRWKLDRTSSSELPGPPSTAFLSRTLAP